MNLVGEMDGSYYLPYQPHATFDTFKKAYPNYEKTFALKQKLDPNNRMRNVLVDKYYSEFLWEEAHGSQYVNTIKDVEGCEFRNIFSNTTQADKLFLFLQNVYHIYPEKAFFNVIKNSTITYTNDKAIYTDIQKKLKDIKPFLSDIFYWLPALKKQKNVIIEQLLQLIDTTKQYDWYLEIWTTWRHINDLKENISLTWEIYTTNYSAPDNSPWEIFERGQLKENSKHFPLNDYEILTNNIEKESVDLVFMPIWIHHIEEKELFMYIKSIHDVLRTWWTFVLRDHNAHNEDMVRYCSNIHTVFNLWLNVSYEDDKNEYRNFQSIEYWIKLLDEYGFKQEWLQLLQDNDPSLNTLLAFRKI